jgi:hypothetical protein
VELQRGASGTFFARFSDVLFRSFVAETSTCRSLLGDAQARAKPSA